MDRRTVAPGLTRTIAAAAAGHAATHQRPARAVAAPRLARGDTSLADEQTATSADNGGPPPKTPTEMPALMPDTMTGTKVDTDQTEGEEEERGLDSALNSIFGDAPFSNTFGLGGIVSDAGGEDD